MSVTSEEMALTVGATPPPARSRSVRRLTLAVALVALAHGLLWSIFIPPFQAPDETEHFAYAQYLAETAKLPPKVGNKQYSSEELGAFNAIGTIGILGHYLGKPPATESTARAAEAAIRKTESLPRADGGGPSSASSQPPLAYALWSIPYHVGSGGSILTRLWLMRLLSVACFVATAVGVALVARELLPSWSWAPLVAGLVVALQPSLAFVSASVNPDTLLFAVSTFALLVAVRILRGGLTLRRALVLGALTGVGLVTKLTFLGLVPGLALALLLGLRASAGGRVRLAAAGIGTAAVLPAVFVIWATAQGRGLMPPGGGVILLPDDEVASGSLRGLLSYAWQLYLPRPSFIHDFFGFWPPYTTWLQGFVGRLGWLDYGPPRWIYPVGGVLLTATFALIVAALARLQRFRRHWKELAVFALCALGLAAQIAAAGYDYHRRTGYVFEQARYLFPLIALYGVGIVAACTTLGRRWAPTLAAGYVGIAMLHVLAVVFSTAARYYG